jgi:parallel beta-helix repeat protein
MATLAKWFATFTAVGLVGCSSADSVDPARDTAQAVSGSGSGFAVPAAPKADALGTYDSGGSVSVLDTAFPIPSGALFVSPNGNDSNSGSEEAPMLTIHQALNRVLPGGTVVLRAGVYREGSLLLLTPSVTLEAYPHDQVWIKGSLVLTAWIHLGPVWRYDDWTYQYADDTDARAIDPQYPLAGRPDMVFVDGLPLLEVASVSDVTAGTFFADPATSQLYIGTDPTGHVVEAAAQRYALLIDSAAVGATIRGLGFEHYANSYLGIASSTVSVEGARATVAENTFAYNQQSGMAVSASNCTVESNTFAFNGQVGFQGSGSAGGLLVTGNAFAFNNLKHFSMSWNAAGAKSVTITGSTWQDNLAEHNFGAGLWFDVSSIDNVVVRNTVRFNTGSGIDYEISSAATIASNLAVGNGTGLSVTDSQNVAVSNNTLSKNVMNLEVMNDGRATPLGDNWSVYDVKIRNNIFSNTGAGAVTMMQVVDWSPAHMSAAQMNVTADYDDFYRTASRSPEAVAEWPAGGSLTPYTTLTALQTATGQESHGGEIDNGPVNPFFVDEAAGDYFLLPTSIAVHTGQALSAYVAACIGVPRYGPIDRGIVGWVGEPTSP